jgi:N-methylhydantoinase A
VTDADLLLGYLDADFFWGGELKLNRGLAERVVEEKVTDKLGVGTTKAVRGIYEVINAKMADAIRVVSIQRGYDPREFALVVAGGAGPIHAAMIAEELEIPLVIVPRNSSVFCAEGMLLTDFKHDFVRSYRADLSKVDLKTLNRLYFQMEEEATSLLAAEGIEDDRVLFSFSADLRYVGQVNEVEVPLIKKAELELADLEKLASEFHSAHESLFGYSLPRARLEMMNLRLTAQGQTEKPPMETTGKAKQDVRTALKGERKAFFNDDLIPTPVYDGLRLGHGHLVSGPAIIEQPTTTLIVTPSRDMRCDQYGSYVLYPKGEELEGIASRFRRGK